MEKNEINIETIKETVSKFIDIIGYAIDFTVAPLDEGRYAVDMTGENLGALIGFHGKNISSIEYIVNLMFSRVFDSGLRVVSLDINGYRKSRLDVIRKYVESTINKVRKTQHSYDLYPMSAYERLYVHNFVKDFPDIESVSNGEEPNRSVTLKVK